jgi:hypothetical protein
VLKHYSNLSVQNCTKNFLRPFIFHKKGGVFVSIVSRIFRSYREALQRSIQRYERAYLSNADHAVQFYLDFLNNLIINYGNIFSNPHTLGQVISRIEGYFQRREIPFVAIDGTCSQDPFSDFMVFFAAAYGVKGCIYIEAAPPQLRYERWSMDQDVSLVAYVPVPYAEAGDITDVGYQEEFVVDDKNKINLSSIHTRLMQLAEIYLAYQMARSSTINSPKLILMDLSLSGVLMSTDVGIDKIHLFGCPIGSRKLEKRDGLVAYAHPFNKELGIPTPKKYRRWTYLVRLFTENNSQPVNIKDLVSQTGISEKDWVKSLNEGHAIEVVSLQSGKILPKFDFSASWFDTVRLFEDFCDRLFHKRDPEALIYPVKEGNEIRYRWMSPEDVAFLVAIGLRALIETCWERGIMLLSVAKDSSTKYFSRNYIGVMREIGVFPIVQVKPLPWTDRMLLESIACQIDDFTCPWAITEFDSVFMTLHVEEENGTRYIRGVRGNVINPERLFARSLAQFFHRKLKPTPLMGHVIFVDRLLDHRLDTEFLKGVVIDTPELGSIMPVYFGTNKDMNYGQAIAVWLLNVLTRNLFPQVIGYPDPLHKADWGATSVKRHVDRLIKSSEIAFRANPLSRLFRTMRDSRRR